MSLSKILYPLLSVVPAQKRDDMSVIADLAMCIHANQNGHSDGYLSKLHVMCAYRGANIY